MKKNLSKTLAIMVILSSVGGSSVPVLAKSSSDSNIENTIEFNKKKLKSLPKVLAKGKVLEKDEILIRFKKNDELRNYIESIEKIEVNGIEYESSWALSKNNYIFSVNLGGLLISFTDLLDGKNEILIRANGYEDNTIKINKADIEKNIIKNKFSNDFDNMDETEKLVKETSFLNNIKNVEKKSESEVVKEKEIKENNKNEVKINNINKENFLTELNNKLEDGVYTLGFDSYKLDSNESSMLGKFFDENVKLEVKNKKMTLTLLNTVFAEMMIDFRLGTDNKFTESSKKYLGDPDANGIYSTQIITVPIENLTKESIVAVLVSAMGGQKSDIGNIKEYRKARLVFKNTYKKGWDGFIYSSNLVTDDEKLNKALIQAGLDSNRDGHVNEEELSKASGTIDLSGYQIKDISKLKYLGSNVEKLFLGGNLIESLPKGIFDNLVNLKTLSLTTNNIKFLPKGVFDKLTNLKELQLANNKIKYIQEGTFDRLTNLRSISLYSNDLDTLSDNIFDKTIDLEGIYLYKNKLKKIPNSIFKCKKLERLYLSNNNIKSIANEITDLHQLKELYLDHNEITILPNEVYNLKNLTYFNIKDNKVKEILDNIEKVFPKVLNIDVSLNELNGKIHCDLDKVNMYPQKSQMKTTFKAENGKVSLNYELTPLDILYWQKQIQTWSRTSVKKKPSNAEELKMYLEGKKALDALNDKGYDWTIKSEIQKKDKGGVYRTLHTVEKVEEEFTPINYIDEDMMENDEYRIVITVASCRSDKKELDFMYEVNGVAKVAENKAIKNKDYKLFEIKNSIEDTSEIGKDMVRKVLKDITKVEVKNSKKYLTLDMDTQGYLKDIHIFIDGKQIPYQEIKDEGNNLRVKLETPKIDSKIGMKLFVIPMNRYVEFSIVHDKNTLKELKNNPVISIKSNINKENKANIELCKDNEIKEYIKNEIKENKKSEDNLNIKNGKVLPRTGQPIGVSIFSILGASITGIGLLLRMKKRK